MNRGPLRGFRGSVEGAPATPVAIAITLVELREKYPNLNALMGRAVATIIAWRLRKTGDPKVPSAMSVIGEEVTDEHDQLAIGRAALAEAQMDCRYWGVQDPDKKWYCGECRNAKPVRQFSGHDTCNRCRRMRRRESK